MENNINIEELREHDEGYENRKKEALKILRENPKGIDYRFFLKLKDEGFLDDKEFVKEAIRYNTITMTFLSDELKKDDEIIKIFDNNKTVAFWNVEVMNSDAPKKLEKDIMDRLLEEVKQKILTKVDDCAYDIYVDISGTKMPRKDGDSELIEGILFETTEEVFDDEVYYYRSPTGVFIPLDNFSDARVVYWNEKMKEDKEHQRYAKECMEPVIEAVKTLPYNNATELLMKCKEEQEHEVEEIEDVVSDRIITGLNKTVDDIQEVEKVEEKEDKKKNKKDIVDDE